MPDVRGRRRAVVAAVLGSTLLSTAGLIGSTAVKSPAQIAAETRPPDPSVLTAPVERRVLTQTVTARGTVAASATVEVTPVAAAAGTGAQVVTAVRVARGATVEPGDVLLEVSGRPLIALPGTVPAYRDLRPGAAGDDVRQLQEALRTLGHYAGGDRAGRFGPATKAAVRKLYAAVGHEAADTGGPGGVADQEALFAAQDAVDVAQRAVDTMVRRIAEGHPEPSTAGAGEEPLSVQLAYLRKTLTRAQQAYADLVARTGPMMPLAELVFLPSFPARVSQFSAAVGDQVKAPLITLSAGALRVTARLRPDQAPVLKPGLRVEIAGEGIAAAATGTVTAVGGVTTDAPAESQGQAAPATPYLPVVVTPAGPLDAQWAGRDVRLVIVAAQTAGEVLVVPLSAVSSAADGTTSVSTVDGARIPVTPGLSGDGFVEVVPREGGLEPGDRVVVGR
ncbi:peptidoglycan-binding protein [Virgisporangium aurantiacum]|uniref:Peptidoglycan binding-like domain-containing protein n=1 Tax=Virgisporangium aurantiacum TaxID=175570 RepID=A0A8J3ZCE9_9ACTN|nr:peptidoglycan-binding domain-containing protein [Virgisporangium aurantiacum]GIJ60273.1 hypothetical protein Vau01_077890 [Virgisporangium aurantiacum]